MRQLYPSNPSSSLKRQGNILEWEADGIEFERKTLSGRATIQWSAPVPLSAAGSRTGRGVYVLEGKNTLYVGEGNLQDRIRAHQSGLIRMGVPLTGYQVRFGTVRRNSLGSLQNVEHVLVRHLLNQAKTGAHKYKVTNRRPKAQVKVGTGGIRVGNRFRTAAPSYLRGPIKAQVDPSKRVTLFELEQGEILGSDVVQG